ncbi:hypothetical protein LJR039_005023 [Pseudorhodoferax sp. LjRoot39]|uniref:hypothetical protein n=1 Tax=Pseudorhodoferax sp. LjRoot39 TaxID=3342328 RepID=UPI003ED0745C
MSFLTNTPFLSVAQIGEKSSALDALHTRVLKAIERLNKDVQTRKIEISRRWGTKSGHATTDGGQHPISPADMASWSAIPLQDRERFATNETLASIRIIKQTAEPELNKYLKDAGPMHEALMSQRPYYSSPVQVLNRVSLGDPKRTTFLHQLQFAGPAELGHLAQVAVATHDVPLAAAVVSLLDRMPTKERPVGPVEVAAAMKLEEFVKVQQYLKLGDARLQGIIIAVRTWKQGKSNPINTLSMALRERDLEKDILKADGGEDDAPLNEDDAPFKGEWNDA